MGLVFVFVVANLLCIIPMNAKIQTAKMPFFLQLQHVLFGHLTFLVNDLGNGKGKVKKRTLYVEGFEVQYLKI